MEALRDARRSRGLSQRELAARAGTIEVLCAEADLCVPPWCDAVPALREPWFVSRMENLKATALAEELATRDVVGEVGLRGGAVAERMNAPTDWLNDAAKGFFLSEPPRIPMLEYPHLRVWAPTAEYMLAMKCVAARFDTKDRDDVEFLIHHLELDSTEAVLRIVSRYCPRERIPAKARFLVEELLE